MLACMLPANEGAEEAGHHPLELVPEDAVDDEVDGAVNRHQEVVSLCKGMVDLPKVLKNVDSSHVFSRNSQNHYSQAQAQFII